MRLLVEATVIVDVGEDFSPLDEVEFTNGTILAVPQGTVEWHNINVGRIVTPADVKCDFCGEPPAYKYPCENFPTGIVVEGVEEGSMGAWAACGPCAFDIDTGNWDSLAQRSYDRLPVGVKVPQMLDLLIDLHQRFHQNRMGEKTSLSI